MALRPETALLKRPDGEAEEVPAGDLRVNDLVVLRPGARVPAECRLQLIIRSNR